MDRRSVVRSFGALGGTFFLGVLGDIGGLGGPLRSSLRESFADLLGSRLQISITIPEGKTLATYKSERCLWMNPDLIDAKIRDLVESGSITKTKRTWDEETRTLLLSYDFQSSEEALNYIRFAQAAVSPNRGIRESIGYKVKHQILSVV